MRKGFNDPADIMTTDIFVWLFKESVAHPVTLYVPMYKSSCCKCPLLSRALNNIFVKLHAYIQSAKSAPKMLHQAIDIQQEKVQSM